MMGIFDKLRPKARPEPTDEKHDSILFSTAFAGLGVDASLLIPWEARATEVDAKRLTASRGTTLLQGLWAKDKYMSHLDAEAIQRLERYFDFASVPAR